MREVKRYLSENGEEYKTRNEALKADSDYRLDKEITKLVLAVDSQFIFAGPDTAQDVVGFILANKETLLKLLQRNQEGL